jgi:hypothetical protein
MAANSGLTQRHGDTERSTFLCASVSLCEAISSVRGDALGHVRLGRPVDADHLFAQYVKIHTTDVPAAK